MCLSIRKLCTLPATAGASFAAALAECLYRFYPPPLRFVCVCVCVCVFSGTIFLGCRSISQKQWEIFKQWWNLTPTGLNQKWMLFVFCLFLSAAYQTLIVYELVPGSPPSCGRLLLQKQANKKTLTVWTKPNIARVQMNDIGLWSFVGDDNCYTRRMLTAKPKKKKKKERERNKEKYQQTYTSQLCITFLTYR